MTVSNLTRLSALTADVGLAVTVVAGCASQEDPVEPTATLTKTVTASSATASPSAAAETTSAAYPACDGRGILIVQSIINTGDRGAAQHEIAKAVLFAHPSGQHVNFTVPGQCPSLRGQVDRQDVYAAYIDYGFDTDALCRAAANYGGNPRVLSHNAEYVSPC